VLQANDSNNACFSTKTVELDGTLPIPQHTRISSVHYWLGHGTSGPDCGGQSVQIRPVSTALPELVLLSNKSHAVFVLQSGSFGDPNNKNSLIFRNLFQQLDP
jgi:hypothetical protein